MHVAATAAAVHVAAITVHVATAVMQDNVLPRGGEGV